MTVILVLIAISMLVAGGFLGAFIWAIKNGQYEDTYSPSVRILFDNNGKSEREKTIKKEPSKGQK